VNESTKTIGNRNRYREFCWYRSRNWAKFWYRYITTDIYLSLTKKKTT